MNRDHRNEHEGCKVMWPWLRWCSNYRYPSQFVQMALDDVKTMSAYDLEASFRNNKKYDSVAKSKESARSAYISHREKWHEDDLEWVKDHVRIFGDPDRDTEEQIEEAWFHRQQFKAANVLYAYGMFNKKTGQIELDNLKKLK